MPLTKPIVKLGHTAAIYGLAVDRLQQVIYTADGSGALVAWTRQSAQGTLIAQGAASWYSASIIASGKTLMAGNMLGEIRWIDLERKLVSEQNHAHHKGVFGFLPIPKGVISLGGDGVLHLWSGFNCTESLKLSESSLRDASLSTDGATIAIAASDGNIYLLSSHDLSIQRVLLGAHKPACFAVCYSACGQFLFTAGRDAMLCIWDINQEYSLLQAIPAHMYTINAICNHPDGSSFYTASRDRTIKIWDSKSFQLLKVLDAAKFGAHVASVNRLAFLDHELVSCSDDKRICIWSEELK
jgi:WD40 repeat protein